MSSSTRNSSCQEDNTDVPLPSTGTESGEFNSTNTATLQPEHMRRPNHVLLANLNGTIDDTTSGIQGENKDEPVPPAYLLLPEGIRPLHFSSNEERMDHLNFMVDSAIAISKAGLAELRKLDAPAPPKQ